MTKLKRQLKTTLWRVRWQTLNGWPGDRECYICHRRFRSFYPYHDGINSLSAFIREAALIGSDVVNFGCPYCRSNDRERHLFLYFDRIKLWHRFQGASILHFAPEKNLSGRIKQCALSRYVQADFFPEHLYPENREIERVDATNIQFVANSFDGLICNHVLEHVPDARKALAEFFRVLKPGGFAILQTPFSSLFENTIEDSAVNTPQLRHSIYGQDDHVRLFGRDFLKRISESGLKLQLVKHTEVSTLEEARRFGMNASEDLIMAQKP